MCIRDRFDDGSGCGTWIMISKIFGDYQRNVWKDKKEINYEILRKW